jgi:hypothetical protein
MKQQLENVICIECGGVEVFQKGSLTESGKKGFLCRVCREVVVERRVEEKRIGDRKLLID